MNRQDLKLKEELIKILYKWVHTEHENGLAPMPTEELFTLIKKHERGLLEEIYKYAKDLTSVTDNKKHNTAVLRLLNYLAKLKEVEE